MDETDPPRHDASGALAAASVVLLLVAGALRVASAMTDGWALLYASIACGAVAFACLGVAMWRARDRL